MTERELKQAYLAIEPPADLKGRVLSACRAARKRRGALGRRTAAAACLVLLLSLSAYGLSPVPAVYSGGQAAGTVPVAVQERSLPAAGGDAQNGAAPFSLDGGPRSRMAEASLDGCIPLTFDRAVSVTVSDGTLYRLDSAFGAAVDLGTRCAAAAGEELYWQCAAPEAVLTVRAGLRARTLYLRTEGAGRTLGKE